MIITGFTQSFLHPRLLHKLHLRVLQGSLPSNEAGDLESGFGRFHMFVLVKDAGSSDSGDLGSGCEGANFLSQKVLRQFMLGIAADEGDRTLI